MNKEERDEKINWIFKAVYSLLCHSEKTDRQYELVNEGIIISKKYNT